MNPEEFQKQNTPLRTLKTKKVYDPGHRVQVYGKLANGHEGSVNCHPGDGLAIFEDGSIEYLDGAAMVKQREYAEKENPEGKSEENTENQD